VEVARIKTTSRARTGVLAGAAAVAALAFPGIASAAVNSSVAGGVLTVTSDAADAITITCASPNVQVNGGNPGTGAALCADITSIVVTGGPGANTIDLAGVNGTDFSKLASVTLNGGAGTDTIHGSQVSDRIVGGDNNDDVNGNGGNDTLVWNGGDDDDINDGDAGVDTIEVNGAAAFGETFAVKPSATPGRVRFDRLAPTPTPIPGFFNLDIGTSEQLDLRMNGGDDTFTADQGLDALGFKVTVDGGDGNDNIDGSDGPDLLKGGNGDDNIVPDDNPAGTRDDARGDAGNDTIVWNGGDDDDINDGGDGTDTSVVNGATAAEKFTIKPGAAGRVSFDRVSTNPAPFNVDIRTTELLRLNANGGDDKIKGFAGVAGLIETELNGEDGNDEIRGTDAEDRINGGNGHDIVNSRDRAEDLVDCGAGFDLAFVDRRDFLRNCNIVLGGFLRVKVPAKTLVASHGVAALHLKCAGTKRCKGVVRLRSGGKTLAAKKFNIKQGSKTIDLKLNRRGLRLLDNAPAKGRKVSVQIDAHDAKGNGWRSTDRIRLKD
jgi:Ca2+-binding RTX toxin-like protein